MDGATNSVVEWLKKNWLIVLIALVVLLFVLRIVRGRRLVIQL